MTCIHGETILENRNRLSEFKRILMIKASNNILKSKRIYIIFTHTSHNTQEKKQRIAYILYFNFLKIYA